jgi:hypothetical protein
MPVESLLGERHGSVQGKPVANILHERMVLRRVELDQRTLTIISRENAASHIERVWI